MRRIISSVRAVVRPLYSSLRRPLLADIVHCVLWVRTDETRMMELERIRNMYIPEVVIRLTGVLYRSRHVVPR